MAQNDPNSAPADASRRTLGHYDSTADAFWAGTRDHDVTQNTAALLDALSEGHEPRGSAEQFRLLDLGCGPGRDLVTLRALGHRVTGLDGADAFVEMARAHSGCPVLKQNFLELDLGEQQYDGVFANASLFHVPRSELPRVLRELYLSLRPGGVLFSSNPRSFDVDREGWNGERYGSYLTIDGWLALMAGAGFEVERHFLRPSGKPASEQPWLAIVARRPIK